MNHLENREQQPQRAGGRSRGSKSAVANGDIGAGLAAIEQAASLPGPYWLARVPVIGELTYRVMEDWQQACKPRYYAPPGHSQ